MSGLWHCFSHISPFWMQESVCAYAQQLYTSGSRIKIQWLVQALSDGSSSHNANVGDLECRILITSHVHIQHPLNGPKYAKIFTHIYSYYFFGVVEYSGKGLSMIPHVHSLVILDPADKLDSFDPIYWTHPKSFPSESLLKSLVFPQSSYATLQ